jgi:hypothetical protein
MNNLNEYKKRFNTLMESTIGNVKPLIMEQSAIWQDVQGTGNGYKEVSKKFAAVPLMDPKTGKQWASVEETDKEKTKFVYLGAELVMMYNEPVSLPKSFDAAQKAPHFGYWLGFRFTYDAGKTTFQSSDTLGWHIRCNKLADNKFHLKNQWFKLTPNSIYAITDKNDTDRSRYWNTTGLNTTPNGFPANPMGFAPDLIPQINETLNKYGYPILKKQFQVGETIA